MSVLKKLTEGIASRSLQREGAALLEKWERTGLLEGIENDSKRQGMARMLENQAAQLLKEASSMAAGDVEGFASVAFPIVRRVFGGLLANDLVSVQPMSLPSGLIFFLDFTYSDETTARLGLDQGDSLYGGGVVASQVTGGVTDITETGGGFYNMANAYSSPTGSVELTDAVTTANPASMNGGEINDGTMATNGPALVSTGVEIESLTEAQKAQIRFDPDILANEDAWLQQMSCVVAKLTQAQMDAINLNQLQAMTLVERDLTPIFGATSGTGANTDLVVVRRLTHLGYTDSTGGRIAKVNGVSTAVTNDVTNANFISFYLRHGSGVTPDFSDTDAQQVTLIFPRADAFANGSGLGSVKGADHWALEEASGTAGVNSGQASDQAKNQIPEIDIKVDSIAVTAVTKKLKAKWSPELGQDLNAYHNLDAEVELTQILSEQIALEIDREILNDLVQGSKAGTYYWSRSPGLFVNRTTGAELGATAAAPDFTGTVSEWYETLVETVNDVSAQIHRKTLRGGANFLVTSPEVANILEFTSGFRASVTHDSDKGSVGAVNAGSLSKKWDVWVDPYFPRNLILIGRRGSSFLESGYVYAPYVPLQVTPTIFGTEDFVPRKGVMTRYAKKMVRPDMYGLVVVRGLLGESGAS